MRFSENTKKVNKIYSVKDEAKFKEAEKWWHEDQTRTNI